MNSVSAIALCVHLMVIFSAYKFLHSPHKSRNRETSLVAALMAISVGVILLHLVNWAHHHFYDTPLTVTDSILGAISFFNGVLYLALIRCHLELKTSRRL